MSKLITTSFARLRVPEYKITNLQHFVQSSAQIWWNCLTGVFTSRNNHAILLQIVRGSSLLDGDICYRSCITIVTCETVLILVEKSIFDEQSSRFRAWPLAVKPWSLCKALVWDWIEDLNSFVSRSWFQEGWNQKQAVCLEVAPTIKAIAEEYKSKLLAKNQSFAEDDWCPFVLAQANVLRVVERGKEQNIIKYWIKYPILSFKNHLGTLVPCLSFGSFGVLFSAW